MKKLLSALLFLGVILTAHAQNAYYDAVKLSQFLNGDGDLKRSQKEVFTILDRYIPPDSVHTEKKVIDALNKAGGGGSDPNPFMEIAGGAEGDRDNTPITKGFERLANSVGDLNVTSLADGMAQFLIERAKEELSVAFFDKLRSDLLKNPELKVLFPTTSSFIEHIEGYNYTYFLQTLREAFQADLLNLPTGLRNLRTIVATDCHGDSKCEKRIEDLISFFKSPESALFVASTIVMDSLKTGSNIADILEAVANDDAFTTSPGTNGTNAVVLANIFSTSLRSNDAERIWITKDEFKSLKDLKILKLYFGLIYQECKNKNIQFVTATGTVKITSLLKPEEITNHIHYLENLVDVGTEITKKVKEIRAKKSAGEKFTTDDYVGYLNVSINGVEALLNWKPVLTLVPTERQNIIAIARSSISIYYNIKEANYSSAISNAFIILDKTLGDRYNFKDEVLRYGAFMASVVQAKSSAEVKVAIEAAVLPAGSASIKKNSEWNISLNAYLGGMYGREFLAEKKSEPWKNISGVSAPIGIAVSHRICAWSLSGFISIIDLGAVVSYRLKDDSTAALPELKLQNIFAPGGGLIVGIPKVPISFGYIYQWGPALREINSQATTVSDKLNQRNYFFIAVDIPLLNFYTTPKNKRH